MRRCDAAFPGSDGCTVDSLELYSMCLDIRAFRGEKYGNLTRSLGKEDCRVQ